MKKEKIKRDIRNRWVKALESGRYKQCVGGLQDYYGSNCCLGVLGRILKVPKEDLLSGGMPSDVGEEYRIKFPTCIFNNEIGKNTKFARSLANLNDSQKDFKYIAKYIKTNTVGI